MIRRMITAIRGKPTERNTLSDEPHDENRIPLFSASSPAGVSELVELSNEPPESKYVRLTILKKVLAETGVDVTDLSTAESAIKYPLHWAIRHGNVNLLQRLLDGSSIPWKMDVEEEALSDVYQGLRPIHLAAQMDNPEAFNILRIHGTDLFSDSGQAYQYSNFSGRLIHFAAAECSLKLLEALKRELSEEGNMDYQSLINAVDNAGGNALHWLVRSGKPAIQKNICARYLLQEGLAVEAADQMGNTPVHDACRAQCFYLLLVMSGLSLLRFTNTLQMTNQNGETPIDLVWQEPLDKESTADFYEVVGAAVLHWACRNGDLDLAEARFCVDDFFEHAFNWMLGTPFSLAAAGNHVTIMELLVRKSGRKIIDIVDRKGNTPLHRAARRNAPDAVSFLLNMGAKITKNHKDETPMDVALYHRSEDAAFAFVNSPQWQTLVKHPSDKYGTVLLGLVRCLPAVLSKCLNRCIQEKTTYGTDHKNSETKRSTRLVCMDYSIFYGPRHCKGCQENLTPIDILQLMACCGQQTLLAHRVCRSLLEQMWIRYGLFCSAILLLANYTLVLLASYILVVFVQSDLRPHLMRESYTNAMLHNYSSINSSAFDEMRTQGFTKGSAPLFTFTEFVIFGVVYGLSTAVVLVISYANFRSHSLQIQRDLSSLVRMIGIFCFEWANVVCVGLLIMASVLLRNSIKHHVALEDYLYPFGAVYVMCGWLNLMRCCRPFGTFGLYAIMLFRIVQTLAKVLLFFSLMIVGFALAFFILFQSQIFPKRQHFYDSRPSLEPLTLRTGHDHLRGSVFRVLAMTTGDLEFLGTFLYPLLDGMFQYPVTTALAYLAFLTLMPILLNNLMIGLAIGDMESVRANAASLRREIHVNLHFCLEKCLPDRLLQRFHADQYVHCHEYRCFQTRPTRTVFQKFAIWMQSGSCDDSEQDTGPLRSECESYNMSAKRARQTRLKFLDPSVTKRELDMESDELLYHKLKRLTSTVQQQGKELSDTIQEQGRGLYLQGKVIEEQGKLLEEQAVALEKAMQNQKKLMARILDLKTVDFQDSPVEIGSPVRKKSF